MQASPISSELKKIAITMEFDVFRRLIAYVDADTKKNLKEIREALEKHDSSMPDRYGFDQYSAFMEGELDDFQYFRDASMQALFVGAWAIFEFRLLEVCQYALKRSGRSDHSIKAQNYSVKKAKKDLRILCVPMPEGQMRELQRLYKIRNRIAHFGGRLDYDPRSKFGKYLKKEQVVSLPGDSNNFGGEQYQSTVNAELTLHKSFCVEKLSVLRTFLVDILQACDEKYSKPSGNSANSVSDPETHQ